MSVEDAKLENVRDHDCLGKHAVVTSRSAVLRQFRKDVKELSSLQPLHYIGPIHDSEAVSYLSLFGSEPVKMNVTLQQGNEEFHAECVWAANLGNSASNGVQLGETVLAKVLVEVLAARRMFQQPNAKLLNSNPVSGNLWWCEDHWIKVENVGESASSTANKCFGSDSVVKVKYALLRQFKEDVKALNSFDLIGNLNQLSDAEVIDCLHLLGTESVKCNISMQKDDDIFCADWTIPTNSVLKSTQLLCVSCGTVPIETVLGRILVEVLASKGLLHKKHVVTSSHPIVTDVVSLTMNQFLDRPCSSTPLPKENAEAGRDQEEPNASEGDQSDSDVIPVTSTSSDPVLHSVHDEYLDSLRFEADQKVIIHDDLLEEPTDMEVEIPSPKATRRHSVTSIPESRPGKRSLTPPPDSRADSKPPKRSLKFPNRSHMMRISLAGPDESREEKDRVLSMLERDHSIEKLTGLRCNMDPKWSLQVLECAVRCKKLRHVEVMFVRMEHWYLVQKLCFLRKLEIYADDELYQNPPVTINLPPSHALRISTIQAEGLHPSTLSALMRVHKGSLTRLEVLVDLPNECSLPKDRPIGRRDGGRPLSDAELRKLLERSSSQASQYSQETSTKLVRLALRKPHNVPLPVALPLSMFPKEWRRVGVGRAGKRGKLRRAGARLEAPFFEYAVPVEEDCRRFPNLQVLILLRPTEKRHSSRACTPQIAKLRRKWPLMMINCNNCGDKKKKKNGQTQRGSSAPINLANSIAKDNKTNFYYFHRK